MAETYLGIDPGSSKTGLALVGADGAIVRLQVAASAALAEEIEKFLQGVQPLQVIIGDGTNSKAVQAVAAAVFGTELLVVINEQHSTEAARTLYWQEHPVRGWRALVPLGLLTPPEPLDAYAAVVLVRRYLRQKENGADNGGTD